MKQLLLILSLFITLSSYGQKEKLIDTWTNGYQMYSSYQYNDSLIVFQGNDSHEAGYYFSLKPIDNNLYQIIGGHPQGGPNPSIGEKNYNVTYKNINNIGILLVSDQNGNITEVLRTLPNVESLEELILQNKINFELCGKYIDANNNIYIFHPNENRATGFFSTESYSFEFEFDYPIQVITFSEDQSIYYETTTNGLDIFNAILDKYNDWQKAEKILTLKQVEWLHPSNEDNIKGRYPFASYTILTNSILGYFNLKELKIMRNEIFARHGYIFQTQEMKNHFELQNWYKGRYKDVNKELSDLEKLNIKLIRLMEKKKTVPNKS